MAHEKVKLDAEGSPKQNSIADAVVFERISLCPSKDRDIRLGCAHTMVNVHFKTILSDLKQLIPTKWKIIASFELDFNALILKIYTLDHKRGNLEHDLALLHISSGPDIDREKLLESIRDLELDHDGLMSDLDDLKQAIIEAVGKN